MINMLLCVARIFMKQTLIMKEAKRAIFSLSYNHKRVNYFTAIHKRVELSIILASCFIDAMVNILYIQIKLVPRKLVQVQVILLFRMSPDKFHIFLSRKFYTFMYRVLRIFMQVCSRKAKRKYYMKRTMNKMEVKA